MNGKLLKKISSSISIYYNDEQKEMMRMVQSLLRHLKDKTGYSNGQLVFKALHEYNLSIDERGNKI
jgi:antitoxin component YwqK of YwqJK toxin-antitoxin module